MGDTDLSVDIVSSLTSALAESNDLLAALYSLTQAAPQPGESIGAFWALRISEIVPARYVELSYKEEIFSYGNASESFLKVEEPGDDFTIVRSSDEIAGGDSIVVAMPRSSANYLAIELDNHCSTSIANLVRSVANYVDAALATADTRELEVTNKQLSRDIEMAATITDSLIPKTTPTLPGWNLTAKLQPARIASGDFYTFSVTDRSVIAAIGDVSGKGIPAAVAATVIVSTFSRLAASSHGEALSELTQALNSATSKFMNQAAVFSTLCLIKGDHDKIEIVNCGHSPVMVKTDTWSVIDAHCPPLGVLDDLHPEPQEFKYEELNALLVASDGLVEQTNRTGEQLGYEAFYDLVINSSSGEAGSMIDSVCGYLQEFAEGRPQDDDRTLVVLEKES